MNKKGGETIRNEYKKRENDLQEVKNRGNKKKEKRENEKAKIKGEKPREKPREKRQEGDERQAQLFHYLRFEERLMRHKCLSLPQPKCN